MKKLIAFGVLLLLGSLSVVTGSALPLLLQLPQAYTMGISDADLTAITAYAANKQADIIGQTINGMDIAGDVMVMPGVKNKVPMPKLKVGKGFRPYSGDEEFRVKKFKYTDRYLEVKVGKYEFRIDPEDYMNTYLAWVNSAGSDATKTDIPFAEFLFNEVIAEVQSELNDETAYKGFDSSATADFNPASTYTAASAAKVKFAPAADNPLAVKEYFMCIVNTSAGESPDTHPAKWQNVTARAVTPGLESLILAGITASEISPVATGAITATEGVALTAFNKLFRAWSSPYRNKGIIISCSQTDMDYLIDDILTKYSKYTREDLSNAPYIYLPNSNKKCIVKVATWLGTSRRLISGPSVAGDVNGRHKNLYMGTDLESDISTLSVMKTELWRLKAGLKARVGFQIQDMESIKVGDQS
ncbi:MAG TPA: hypothetical protein VGK59_10875 [Ohtaekwangia sp.]